MKNLCIIFLALIIITITAVGFTGVFALDSQATTQAEYLRIHIRADDNSDKAQSVKFAVRDAVVDYLTPIIAECKDKASSVKAIEKKLNEIQKVADLTLQRHGFYYGASAKIEREVFPTRVYGEYTLPSGEYTALILRLGKGTGDNWWCVVYPPLCFTGGTKIEYKSKILEIIKNWKNS